MVSNKARRVRVELSADIVARLLADGQVCAADLHCLDCGSKQCVLKIVLDACRPNQAIWSRREAAM